MQRSARPWFRTFVVSGLRSWVRSWIAFGSPSRRRAPPPPVIQSPFGDHRGRLAKLNLGLCRFALKSVLWLRQTRHLVLKPSPAPPPDRPIREVAWAHWLRCAWMGDRLSAGQPGRSVLCRAEQTPGQARLLGAVKFPLTLSTRSKSTLARHRGRGVGQGALAGREAIRGCRYQHPLTISLPILRQIPDVHPQSRPRAILPARQSRQGPGHTASHPQSLPTRPRPGPSCPSQPMDLNPPVALRLLAFPSFRRGSKDTYPTASDPMR